MNKALYDTLQQIVYAHPSRPICSVTLSDLTETELLVASPYDVILASKAGAAPDVAVRAMYAWQGALWLWESMGRPEESV